jgi:hypothetical protein
MQAPTESVFHHVVEIVTTIGIPAIIGGLLKVIWGAAKTHTDVQTIMTNHLPHLDAKIDGVASAQSDLQKAFIRHLDKGDD